MTETIYESKSRIGIAIYLVDAEEDNKDESLALKEATIVSAGRERKLVTSGVFRT